MGMLSGTQKHVNCFDQGVKCFCEIFLAWDGQPSVFSKIKARFDCWNFSHFIKLISLRFWLAHNIDMTGLKRNHQKTQLNA